MSTATPTITPNQLAAVLQRAINLRFDVKRAVVSVAPEDTETILFQIEHNTEGRRRLTETRFHKLVDGRSVRQIIIDIIGPEPDGTGKRATAALADRKRWLDARPEEALEGHKQHRHAPINPAPPSTLVWPDKVSGIDTGEGALPTNIPSPTPANRAETLLSSQYRDAITNEVRDKLPRSKMIALGMTSEQRSEQYRRQRGRHPLDAS